MQLLNISSLLLCILDSVCLVIRSFNQHVLARHLCFGTFSVNERVSSIAWDISHSFIFVSFHLAAPSNPFMSNSTQHCTVSPIKNEVSSSQWRVYLYCAANISAKCSFESPQPLSWGYFGPWSLSRSMCIFSASAIFSYLAPIQFLHVPPYMFVVASLFQLVNWPQAHCEFVISSVHPCDFLSPSAVIITILSWNRFVCPSILNQNSLLQHSYDYVSFRVLVICGCMLVWPRPRTTHVHHGISVESAKFVPHLFDVHHSILRFCRKSSTHI